MTHPEILELLRTRIAQKLKKPPDSIGLHTPLDELGLDSLELVNFSGEVEQRLGIRIEPTALWDFRTLWKLSAYLAQKTNTEIFLPESEEDIDALLSMLEAPPR